MPLFYCLSVGSPLFWALRFSGLFSEPHQGPYLVAPGLYLVAPGPHNVAAFTAASASPSQVGVSATTILIQPASPKAPAVVGPMAAAGVL